MTNKSISLVAVGLSALALQKSHKVVAGVTIVSPWPVRQTSLAVSRNRISRPRFANTRYTCNAVNFVYRQHAHCT